MLLSNKCITNLLPTHTKKNEKKIKIKMCPCRLDAIKKRSISCNMLPFPKMIHQYIHSPKTKQMKEKRLLILTRWCISQPICSHNYFLSDKLMISINKKDFCKIKIKSRFIARVATKTSYSPPRTGYLNLYKFQPPMFIIFTLGLPRSYRCIKTSSPHFPCASSPTTPFALISSSFLLFTDS